MSTKTIYLMHGFNVSDGGSRSIDRLIPYLEGKGRVVDLNYGWTGFLGTRLCNSKLASIMAAMSEPESVFIGHSNGCTIGNMAALRGALFARMIFINPALEVNFDVGPNVRSVHVFHTPHDKPTLLARYRPFSPWGAAGRYGYKGASMRVYNHDMSISETYPVFSHSGVFYAGNLDHWARVIRSYV